MSAAGVDVSCSLISRGDGGLSCIYTPPCATAGLNEYPSQRLTTTTTIMAIDSYSKTQMIALGITFLILPCIFVNLRVWAKWISRGGVQWDDYLIFGALVRRYTHVYHVTI